MGMRKSVAVLGSTGSIGTQTLDVIERIGTDHIDVLHLVANRSSPLLAEQAIRFPQAMASAALSDGPSVLIDAVMDPCVDTVVVAVSGAAALEATIAACKRGIRVCIATKEVLVAAGALVMQLAKDHGATLLPIDSEHSALFQAMQGYEPETIDRMHLTASGGPFRTWSAEQIQNATISDALNHPTWKMGGKITIDSASMMNKGLEIIEACWLYGIPESRVDVVVHPQSIVHSLVEFTDGSLLAQLGYPDMRLPIQIALLHPIKLDTGIPRLHPTQMGTLTFEAPDNGKFPALELARQALRNGGTVPAVMNAANEAVVAGFLENKCSFAQMHDIVADAMDTVQRLDPMSLTDILDVDTQARAYVTSCLEKHIGAS
jgi:1-deoxy-D-xylulose-5-phosphate reductoisomerase